MHRRGMLAMIGLIVAVVVGGQQARAALDEKPVIDEINASIAVMRYLHRQVSEAESNLELVRAARALTQQQLEAQRALVQREMDQGRQDRAAKFRTNLTRLERQMAKLSEVDFEKLYGTRIAELRKQIEAVSIEVDTRITEYAVLFGQRPQVDMDFSQEIERGRARRADAANFLNLD